MENIHVGFHKNAALSRTVLSHQVRDIIVDAILNGDLKAGDRLAENGLARHFGVSQAPVRDAIRDLVMMGFLKSEPYKGACVRHFTPDELDEVYLVRASLEALAARLAAPRLTDEHVRKLRQILDKMIAAAERGNVGRTTQFNNDFHEEIIVIAGNRLLHQLWKTIQFRYWTYVTNLLGKNDLAYRARRHEEVLEGLMTRDPIKAMVAMQHHLEGLRSSANEPEEANKQKEILGDPTNDSK